MQNGLNALGKAITAEKSGADRRSLLDAECKAFLADKQILAWILRDCTPEFREYSIPGIMSCMEGEPEIGTVTVDQALTGMYMAEKIAGMADEDTSGYEGTVRYEIRLKARAKHEDEETEPIINVEAQNNFKPGSSRRCSSRQRPISSPTASRIRATRRSAFDPAHNLPRNFPG